MDHQAIADQHRAGDQVPTDRLPGDAEPVPPEEVIVAVDLLADQVERALARLDDGTYGTCEVCGGAIEEVRLADSPATARCLDCAADGGTDAQGGRPTAGPVDTAPASR